METEKRKNAVTDKKLRSKLIIRFACTVTICVILILSFISFGWFTMNRETEVNSLKMSAQDDGFEIAKRDLEIRGPGEFMGARQSGSALLRFADLETDLDLLEWARGLAPHMLEHDPALAEEVAKYDVPAYPADVDL